MKKIIPALIFSSFTLIPFSVSSQTIQIDIDGLVCISCDDGIVKKMQAHPSVLKAYSNIEKNVILLSVKDGEEIADQWLKPEITAEGLVIKKITRNNAKIESLIPQYADKNADKNADKKS